jgi:hypothetical protein
MDFTIGAKYIALHGSTDLVYTLKFKEGDNLYLVDENGRGMAQSASWMESYATVYSEESLTWVIGEVYQQRRTGFYDNKDKYIVLGINTDGTALGRIFYEDGSVSNFDGASRPNYRPESEWKYDH